MAAVVLDPGVLVSALLNPDGPPGLLLKVWREGGFELVVSSHLLGELTDVLARPKFTRRLDSQAVAELLRLLPEAATTRRDQQPPAAVCRDADDDYLIALAQDAGATLVSGDKDLLSLIIEGLEILSPANALARLRAG